MLASDGDQRQIIGVDDRCFHALRGRNLAPDVPGTVKLRREPTKLEKKSKRGFRGYPVATIAYYGPDDKKATKVVAGIVAQENGEPVLEKFFSESDIRFNPDVNKRILMFIAQCGAKSVVMTDRIIGCPHEEGTDYPEGQDCPHCPYWEGRDRWTGHHIH